MNKNKKNWLLNKRTLSNIIVIFAGILLYLGLSNYRAVTTWASWVLGIFSPFITGFAIAYLLNMPVRFLENRLFKKLRFKRVLSIATTYVVAVFLLVFMMFLVLPQLVDSVMSLLRNINTYLANLGDIAAWLSDTFDIDPANLDFIVISYRDVMNSLAEWGREMLPNVLGITVSIGSGLVGVLTAFIASIYMLASKEKLLRQCKALLYAVFPLKSARGFLRIGRMANTTFSGFISGKISDSAIIGVICYIYMWATGTPLAPLISLVISITNIIPFFGPFIGAIPSAMILLLLDPLRALWFIVFIIILQQFDGNVLGPKILGNSTGLPAFWVLVSIVAGGGLFGFTGMVLGVPIAAVLYTLIGQFVAKRLQKKGVDKNGEPNLQSKQAPAPPRAPKE